MRMRLRTAKKIKMMAKEKCFCCHSLLSDVGAILEGARCILMLQDTDVGFQFSSISRSLKSFSRPVTIN